MAAYLEKDYARAHKYFAEALSLAQTAALVSNARMTQGKYDAGSVCLANKEMPMDEYLHVQCRLGMDLASTQITQTSAHP